MRRLSLRRNPRLTVNPGIDLIINMSIRDIMETIDRWNKTENQTIMILEGIIENLSIERDKLKY